ncbi:MAG: hypothetical protein ABFC71_05155 [Methanoregula sp.]
MKTSDKWQLVKQKLARGNSWFFDMFKKIYHPRMKLYGMDNPLAYIVALVIGIMVGYYIYGIYGVIWGILSGVLVGAIGLYVVSEAH